MKPPLNVTLVTDKDGLAKVADFFRRVRIFGFDTETNITPTFFGRRIRTIQVGDRNEQYVIDLLAFAGSPETLINCQGGYNRDTFWKGNHPLQPVIDVLRPVLDSREWLKVGTNLQFDYEVMKWCLGIRSWNFYDCFLAEKVIYAGVVDFRKGGFYALDDMVGRYCGMYVSKVHQKSFDMSTPLTQDQIDYAGLDTRWPLAVKIGQEKNLTSGDLHRTAQIEFDAAPAFGDMRLNGLLLSKTPWLILNTEVTEKQVRIVEQMDVMFIPAVGRKGIPDHDLLALELEWKNTEPKVAGSTLRAEARKRFVTARREIKEAQDNMESYEGEAAINYASNDQLHAALLKLGFTKKQLPSTGDEILEKVAEHPSWDVFKVFTDNLVADCGVIDLIRLYRETNKLLTTYGEGFITKYLDDDTGRIHSNINQLGADTGRSSSTKPNVQNLPKDPRYRACFIAREGWKILTLDYNGCELRILAELSQERVWLDAFLKDWDVHSVGAEILFGDKWKNAAEEGCAYYKNHQKCKCKEHKKLRDQVKAINFGLAYGMGPKKLADQVGITYQEAVELLNRYKHAFPTVTAYLEESGNNAKMLLESRTICGRRRKYAKPEWAVAMARAAKDLKRKPTDEEIKKKYKGMFGIIERAGKNSPIQGTNADMAKLAMGCGFDSNGKPFLWHTLEPEYGALIENFVHDEIVAEARDEVAEPAFHAIGDAMQRAGAEFVKIIPMTYEGHIGEYWSK
jgi:DNA polymerase I-like protein with 3'-5' exonuclease and polymerase domains